VQYGDGIPGSLTTAHPSRLPDGSLINFSRTLPMGGCHVYKQDPVTLERTQVGRRMAGGGCLNMLVSTGWRLAHLGLMYMLHWHAVRSAHGWLSTALVSQVLGLACAATILGGMGVLMMQVGFVADRRPFSPAWMHDFAATDKYAVLLEQPLYMNLASLTLGTSASHLFMVRNIPMGHGG